MKRQVLILAVCVLLLTPGCYIQRYFQLKKQYETFQVQVNKSKRENIKLRSAQRAKTDSIGLYSSRIRKGVGQSVRSDSMISSYTEMIRKQLGDDPWGDSIKMASNTAENTKYMSAKEKDVIYWLNLARQQPDLYAEMYIDLNVMDYMDQEWRETGRSHYGIEQVLTYPYSCYSEMAIMTGKNVLIPDEECYKSAECHATESGKTGYVGHQRTGCKRYFSGECCHYGGAGGKGIIHTLLIDYGVPSLGHRHICLGYYDVVGISSQPHSEYGYNTVLDFH